MPLILITSALFLIALALVILGLAWGANWLADRLIGAKHRALDAILEDGQVPPQWRGPWERRIARLNRDPRKAAKLAAVQARAQAAYLKKLDELIHYVRVSTLIGSEETRRSLLEELAKVRGAWQN